MLVEDFLNVLVSGSWKVGDKGLIFMRGFGSFCFLFDFLLMGVL